MRATHTSNTGWPAKPKFFPGNSLPVLLVLFRQMGALGLKESDLTRTISMGKVGKMPKATFQKAQASLLSLEKTTGFTR